MLSKILGIRIGFLHFQKLIHLNIPYTYILCFLFTVLNSITLNIDSYKIYIYIVIIYLFILFCILEYICFVHFFLPQLCVRSFKNRILRNPRINYNREIITFYMFCMYNFASLYYLLVYIYSIHKYRGCNMYFYYI